MSSPDLDESTQEALLSICQNKKKNESFCQSLLKISFIKKRFILTSLNIFTFSLMIKYRLINNFLIPLLEIITFMNTNIRTTKKHLLFTMNERKHCQIKTHHRDIHRNLTNLLIE
jgi:hypothetical protein